MKSSAPGGLVDSLRGVGEGLLGTVHDRFELLSVELHEEKFRLIQTFIWITAALFSGMLAVTFGSVTLVYLFWDTARLGVLIGLTGFYLVALGAIALGFRRFLARQPRPFASTLEELRLDRACIRPEN